MVSSNRHGPTSQIPERLERLLSDLCDGSASAKDVAELERLAGTSASARRYVVRYLQLHGELLWSHGRLGESAAPVVPAGVSAGYACDSASPDAPTMDATSRRRYLRRLSAVFFASAAAVIVVGLFLSGFLAPAESQPVRIAALVAEHDAHWGRRDADTEFRAGDRAELKTGYARFRMDGGAEAIIEAPAEIRFVKNNALDLLHGKLAATVPPRARGFKITTPAADVVDLGTEFGVTVRDTDSCEVEVFSGTVEISDPRETLADAASPDRPMPRRLTTGQSVKVVREKDGLSFAQLLQRGSCYIRRLPPPARFAFREGAAKHAALIHQYPFEGVDKRERIRDCRGSLDLLETVMLGGRGDGALTFDEEGLRAETRAVALRRSHTHPNTQGAALQSERTFVPPGRMTIELLLRFDGFPTPKKGSVATAVATRADASDCGFFVTVVEDGQLAHLLDADAAWVETGFVPKPRVWYYVATTFETLSSNQTKINTFVADLSGETPQLRHLLKDQIVPGVPSTGRLGIGKGFDETRAHAYPWSGALDEICVYNDVLEESQLRQRLQLLYRKE